MENNGTDPGSRVTRSLRKRLTSVDSDNCSRACTPVQSKLSSIADISSQSRSTRVTRRNSVSEIVTPSKRVFAPSPVITENVEVYTPVRRNTRRRSISINESEKTTHTDLKVPSFATLSEESVSNEQNSPTNKRITRSQSKSPQQAKAVSPSSLSSKNANGNKSNDSIGKVLKTDIEKRRKSGPRGKTQQTKDVDNTSDVEISVLENGVEMVRRKSGNITAITSTDDESNIEIGKGPKEKPEDVSNNNSRSCTIDNTNINEKTLKAETDTVFNKLDIGVALKGIQCERIDKSVDLVESRIDLICTPTLELESSIVTATEHIHNTPNKKDEHITIPETDFSCPILSVEGNIYEENSLENGMKICISDSEKEIEIEILQDCEMKFTEPVIESCNEENVSNCIENESNENANECIIAQADGKVSDEITNISTLTPSPVNDKVNFNVSECKVLLKRVNFASSPTNDINIKNVYPKTPASTKSKISFIEVDPSRDEESFEVEGNAPKIYNKNCEYNNKFGEKEEYIEKTTPIGLNNYTQTIKMVQSPTPINIQESSYDLLSEKEKAVIRRDEARSDELENEFDVNSQEEKANIKSPPIQNSLYEEEAEIKWINPSVRGTILEGSKLDTVTEIVTDTDKKMNGNDIEIKEVNNRKIITFPSEDDDKETEESNQEHENDRWNDFFDDEAMEVDGYESGDSMDSVERQENIENEIPVDGESIGSHTTNDEDNECIEEEDSENDSFIVSDNEDVECLEIDDENDQVNEYLNYSRKKKNTYKRLQSPIGSSSSSEDEMDNKKPEEDTQEEMLVDFKNNINNEQTDKENMHNESIYEELKIAKENSIDLDKENKVESNFESNSESKYSEKIVLDSSKLSDSAFRLQCTAESVSEEEGTEEQVINISRKEILQKLNQSDRFNKSVRDLNPDIDTSPVEKINNELNGGPVSEFDQKINEDANRMQANKFSYNDKIQLQSESNFGKVSATIGSDNDKENDQEMEFLLNKKTMNSGLSVSFGNYKNSRDNYKEGKEWRRSFTIDVAVKSGDMDTKVTQIKSKEDLLSISPSSTNDQNEEASLKNEDVGYLDNVRHISLPLGNPLIRTRRQSLALPTNPDMEICSSYGSGSTKKPRHGSLGTFPNTNFNPSQSFIDNMELHESNSSCQVEKRKRLSKSFCGASETLDSSIIDIDVGHLHKCSKLICENSTIESHNDSSENMNTSKLSTNISFTPSDKSPKSKSNNNIQHILNRCNEILEAANNEKLAAKMNYKKSKSKLSKKRKKKNLLVSLNEENHDILKKIPKEIICKDKTKTAVTAVTQAIKAADIIIGPGKHTQSDTLHQKSKRLPSDVLKSLEKSDITNKRTENETLNVQRKKFCYTASTSAGNFVELPQSPEKEKKKATYIQLPTGKVSVEPITPQKKLVLACNGRKFRESPITPYAVGFKVREISSGVKRKRHCNEIFKQNILPSPQWTQSGPFIEEEIPTVRKISLAKKSYLRGKIRKVKKRSAENEYSNVNLNFKQNAMMRPDIKRSINRKILELRERRHAQGHC